MGARRGLRTGTREIGLARRAGKGRRCRRTAAGRRQCHCQEPARTGHEHRHRRKLPDPDRGERNTRVQLPGLCHPGDSDREQKHDRRTNGGGLQRHGRGGGGRSRLPEAGLGRRGCRLDEDGGPEGPDGEHLQLAGRECPGNHRRTAVGRARERRLGILDPRHIDLRSQLVGPRSGRWNRA